MCIRDSPWLRPDAKSQVTVEYKNFDGINIMPFRVHTIVISTQHNPEISNEEIKQALRTHVIDAVIPANLRDDRTLYFLNPSGSFIVGGPLADAGLTGRKIIVDTYGGWCGHGGGAFSGKDPSKVDRSGAYAARWVAKSLVAAKLCKRATVQISYGVGIAAPLSVYVNSHGTTKKGVTDDDLIDIVYKNFDLRVGYLIRDLGLRRPIYKALASYGHFGRDVSTFAWENPKKLDLPDFSKGAKKEAKDKEKTGKTPAQATSVQAKPEEKKEAGPTAVPKKKKTDDDLDPDYVKMINDARIKRITSGQKIVPIPGRRNILVTSALPYVNNVPHLGNIIGCVLSADVFARFSRLRGWNTIYIAGTDEYGTATETKALEEKVTPKQLCDKYYTIHKKIYEWFDIDFDNFGRTTTDYQTQITQDIFLKLMNNKYTAEGIVKQLYCLNCSRFLADRYVEGVCPRCQKDGARGDQCDSCQNIYDAVELVDPKCKICKKTPEIRESKHIFLQLPDITDQLKKWAEESSSKGEWSFNSKQATLSWIREGLKPRCITRDLKWGTPVPVEEFKDKVFYVWFDAPIGYLSITASLLGEDWTRWWKNPKDVNLYQFMGKDNVPFHTVIFPSTLMGTKEDYTLLHHVATTEYLLYEGGKFSKSNSLGVFGDDASTTGIPVEVWRYYLLINRPEQSDSDFRWDDCAVKINNELLPNLGNLVQRSLKFTYTSFDQRVPSFEVSQLTEEDRELLQSVYEAFTRYIHTLEKVEIKSGLKIAMEISGICNKYMQDEAPWEKAKKESKRSDVVLGILCNLLRLISAVFEPYMPSFSAKLNIFLGLEQRTEYDDKIFEELLKSTDPLQLVKLLKPNQKLNKPFPLFRELTKEEAEAFRIKFGGAKKTVAQGDGLCVRFQFVFH
eukprot:TRINITY_DN3608_c0_g2_i5.p1 TRINITY_DN3608_c0_g2~~TRINITY_DN3608_c0_g2_i5.p1  ORF type:complete len:936 (+),score=230.30 TRINITY_DN3608_c0_g2_i5:105-2810(+)